MVAGSPGDAGPTQHSGELLDALVRVEAPHQGPGGAAGHGLRDLQLAVGLRRDLREVQRMVTLGRPVAA